MQFEFWTSFLAMFFPETVQAHSGLLIADLKTLISPPNSQSEISYSVKLQNTAIRLNSLLKSLLATGLCRKSTCTSL